MYLLYFKRVQIKHSIIRCDGIIYLYRKDDKTMQWIILVAIIAVSIIYYYAYQNTHKPITNNVEIQLKNSQSANPIKILHLSDFHMERITISPQALFDKLDNENIDIIALTGDYLQRVKNIDKFLGYLEILYNLNPKYGVYVVFGNHDYLLKNKISYFQKIIEETGAIVLRNENRSITVDGQNINLIGIDDFKTKRSDIEKSYKNLKDGVNIVLTHDPNVVLKMNNYHFDYLLSGHFHGGQICWPIPFHLVKMGKLPRRNIFKGLNFSNEKPYYINDGLGQTILNLRLGSRPEITFHTLNS